MSDNIAYGMAREGMLVAALLTAIFTASAAIQTWDMVDKANAHNVIATECKTRHISDSHRHFIDNDLVYEAGTCNSVPQNIDGACRAVRDATAGKYTLLKF